MLTILALSVLLLTPNTVPIAEAGISPRNTVETPAGRRLTVDPASTASAAIPATPYVIARFAGRIDAAARTALAAAGFEEISYLPDDALLLRRPSVVKETAVPGLLAWLPYLPEDRVSRELTPAGLSARDTAQEIPVLVHVMPGESNAAVLDALGGMGLPVIAHGRLASSPSGRDEGWGRIVTVLPQDTASADALNLAQLAEVFFVERIHRIGLLNDRSVGTVQSGTQGYAPAQTPIWNQGIHGEGQVVGEIDTGLDADNCWFRDTARGLPVTNTWSASGGYGTAVGASHRKILAYDFLYSCAQYPAGAACENPSSPTAWDTLYHGTHVAGNMCGDSDETLIVHDAADGVAPGAKIVPQDAGYATDPCGDLPGIGCPVIDTYPLFDQARKQGVRIHNNSYGDNENASPPNQANYTARSQDVDRFMWDHPEFLVVHAAGNSGAGSADFSVGSPATNKNGLAIGSARTSATSTSDENISSFSSRGWTGDGRIKPDLMAPGCNVSSGNNRNVTITNCGTDGGCGTSYASPTAVGAAALARQYFTDGFYPSGARTPSDSLAPTAALLKAVLINSAVPMTGADNSGGSISAIPSNEQGWGRVRLDKALLFAPPLRRLYVNDHTTGIAAGATAPYTHTFIGVGGAEPFKVTLTWTDYPATPDSPPTSPTIGNPASWAAPRLVNDLDLVVTGPSGTFRGNVFSGGVSTTGGSADRRNNIEQVLITAPAPGAYTVTVTPFNVVQGGQQFALVATGAWTEVQDCNPAVPAGLNVTSATETSVTLDWSPGGSPGTAFRVWRTSGTCAEGPWTLAGTTSAPPFTDPALSAGTTYLYRLSAISADGRCESRRSACVTGRCAALPELADGPTTATDNASTCGVSITWPAATSLCPGGGIVYNLYRDASPSFSPGRSNLIASCIPGTSYHDTAQLVSGTAVAYLVRAEDPRVPGTGLCRGGAEDGNTRHARVTPAGTLQTGFSDGFESGLAAWNAVSWSSDGTTAKSGTFSAHSANADGTCATLTLAAPVTIPAGSLPRFAWSARWLTETGNDAGLVQVAPGPAYTAWSNAAPVPAYPGTTSATTTACVPLQTPAYTGTGSSFIDSTASLGGFKGQSIKIRFLYGSNVGQNLGGFWVDDVSISWANACSTAVAEVSPAAATATLSITRIAGGLVRARFQRLAGVQSYNLYEGSMFAGGFYSHGAAAGNRCSAAAVDQGDGTMVFDFVPTPGANRYYLVTAAAGGVEGPSGYASSGAEIPPAQSSCTP
jgi:hypothetical protein